MTHNFNKNYNYNNKYNYNKNNYFTKPFILEGTGPDNCYECKTYGYDYDNNYNYRWIGYCRFCSHAYGWKKGLPFCVGELEVKILEENYANGKVIKNISITKENYKNYLYDPNFKKILKKNRKEYAKQDSLYNTWINRVSKYEWYENYWELTAIKNFFEEKYKIRTSFNNYIKERDC